MIVITGGELSYDNGTGEMPDICITGASQLVDDLGYRFIEQAICKLTDPRSHITFIVPVLDIRAYQALNVARDAGLTLTANKKQAEAHETYSFAAVTGDVQTLSTFSWMNLVSDMLPYYLLVSRDAETEFSVVTQFAALTGQNIYEQIDSMIAEINEKPQCICNKLGDYELLLMPADSHGRSIQINRQEPSLTGVDEIFARCADEYPLNLYDAGNLRDPDIHGWYFTDFQLFERWQQMPKNWKRVK